MDDEIGTTNMHYEACETCIYRKDDPDDDCGNCCPDMEDDYIVCCNYKKGDPRTPEEIKAEEQAARFTELDKDQEKLFVNAGSKQSTVR